MQHLAFEVGEGNCILFWRGLETFLLSFCTPIFLHMQVMRKLLSLMFWVTWWMGIVGGGGWNLRFHWDFHEWELEVAFCFLEHIYSRVSRGEARGRIHWCLEGSGKFDTQSFYQVIRVATNCLFPW